MTNYKPINFFSNSVTIPIEIANPLNQFINDFLREAHFQIANTRVNANLYIGGSLARHEPTILSAKSKLKSDIDFGLIINDSDGKNKLLDIEHLLYDLANQYKFEMSLLASPNPLILARDMPQALSTLGWVNMFLGLKNARVIENFKLPDINTPIITTHMKFNCFIVRLESYVLNFHPSTSITSYSVNYRSDMDYYLLYKMITDGLLALIDDQTTLNQGTSFLYKNRHVFKEIMKPEDIESLILNLEQYDENVQCFYINPLDFCIQCLRKLLLINDNSISTSALLESASNRFFPDKEKNVINSLRTLSMFGAFYLLHSQTNIDISFRKNTLEICNFIIKNNLAGSLPHKVPELIALITQFTEGGDEAYFYANFIPLADEILKMSFLKMLGVK